MCPLRLVAVCCCALAGLASGAAAQTVYTWRAIVLHPPGAYRSEAYGVSLSGVSGYIEAGDDPNIDGASLWPSRVRPLILLTPQGWTWSRIDGADGAVQGGYVLYFQDGVFETHAALWSHTTESFIDLDPGPPFHCSSVTDVCSNQQVGNVCHPSGQSHAAVWFNGDPKSVIDLHPAGAGWSWALATDGYRQGGRAAMQGTIVAVLWKGTAASAVVMHDPGGSFKTSQINGMAPGAQVGSALLFQPLRDHAILWRDTPESWIDMHPSFHPNKNSYMFATTGDLHVGRSSGRAGIWFGDDPDSFHDLHQYVPGSPGGSNADDIAIRAGRVYIAGRATFTRTQAVVWIGTPVPAAPQR